MASKKTSKAEASMNRLVVIILGAGFVFLVFAGYILFLQRELLTSQTAMLQQQISTQNLQIQELQNRLKGTPTPKH